MGEPRKPVLMESMHQEEIAGYRVRIWVNEEVLEDGEVHNYYGHNELNRAISDLQIYKCQFGYDPDINTIVERISEVKEVTALEVTNSNGDGVVLYFEWP